MTAELAPLLNSLKQLMRENATGMEVVAEGEGGIKLLAPWNNPRQKNEKMWFGGVRLGKAYVSFHLMPVYTHAALAASISPDLKKRMQGKSCFNFRKPDPALFAELASLTRRAAQAYATPMVLS